MQLITFISILAFSSSAFCTNISDLGDEAFNITAPVSQSIDGKIKDTQERYSITCFTYNEKIECSLKILGFSCSKEGRFHYGEYDTSTGNMKLRRLDLSLGILSFEYSMSGDSFTCDGRFLTKSGMAKLTDKISIPTKSHTFKTFTCQGVFSKLGGAEITNKLRSEQNISKLCGNIPF